jgi:S-sulfo-L-cysteine synthase (O-acetyl-L-serine-dependent)
MANQIIIENNLIRKITSLREEVGNTPLFRFSKLFSKKNVEVFGKQEWFQLSGSVKSRAAYSILFQAISSGQLHPGKALLDATSGNTGIAYATLGARLGIEVVLCLPENASAQRKEILTSLGARIIYTSRFEGTDGAQEVAKELAEKFPEKYFYADQYKNQNNWKAHYHGTALEILNDQPGITDFVAGLGTTGTFVGTARRLKEFDPAIRLTSLQPDVPMHGLEGWKHLETAVVPGIYDKKLADDHLEISTEEAYEYIKAAHRHEGLVLSPSSGANLAGAIRVAEKLDEGIVVTVLPDNGDKYQEILKNLL